MMFRISNSGSELLCYGLADRAKKKNFSAKLPRFSIRKMRYESWVVMRHLFFGGFLVLGLEICKTWTWYIFQCYIYSSGRSLEAAGALHLGWICSSVLRLLLVLVVEGLEYVTGLIICLLWDQYLHRVWCIAGIYSSTLHVYLRQYFPLRLYTYSTHNHIHPKGLLVYNIYTYLQYTPQYDIVG